jgi:hypothetical protein
MGQTNRGGPRLLKDDKYYTIVSSKRVLDSGLPITPETWKINWKCSGRNCKATGCTDRQGDAETGAYGVFSPGSNPDHATTCHWNAMSVPLEHIKKKVLANFKADNRQQLNLHAHYAAGQLEVQTYYPELTGWFPAKLRLASTASRTRCERVPPLPQGRADIPGLVVPDRWGFSNLPPFGRFVQCQQSQGAGPGAMSMMVLGNDQAFRDLCGTNRVFIDGTFSVCPRPYYQLFCVHYLHGLRMIPALYVLMTHKTADMYSILFTWMSGEALREGNPFLGRPAGRWRPSGWHQDQVLLFPLLPVLMEEAGSRWLQIALRTQGIECVQCGLQDHGARLPPSRADDTHAGRD